MIGWILDKIFNLIPFLHGRGKAISAAREKLQHLRAQLIAYAVQGSLYSGNFDENLIAWAKNEILSSPDLAQHEDYSKVSEGFGKMLEDPEIFAAAYKTMQPSEQGKTMFFPKLEKPVIEAAYLYRDDVRLFSEMCAKLNAINSMSDDIRNMHEKTFDNSLNEHQLKSVKQSINKTYKNLSTQSEIAATKIGKMKLIN